MIFKVTDIDIRRVPGRYPFPAALLERIAPHWQEKIAGNPHLWNGRILSMIAPTWPGGVSIRHGRLTAAVLEDDYAAFIAWRDWNFPEIGIRNSFGAALIRGSDGALVYGVMDARTANAGRIYPPSGSLEPRDLDGDRVDLIRSMEREMREETGLSATDAGVGATFAVLAGPQVAICRVYQFDETAAMLAERIRATLPTLDPELTDVVIVRRGEDLDPLRAPPFAMLAARHVLAP